MTVKSAAWTFVLKKDESAKTLELSVYDIIGKDFWTGDGVTAAYVLQKLRSTPDAKKIVLRINSIGGIVSEATAMINLLRERAADGVEIEAHVDGIAASAASFLTTAADRVLMPDNAFMMVHAARSGMRGTQREMQRAAETLAKVDDQIATSYAAASERRGKNKTKADYLALMADGDHYFTAAEAIEWGLADESVEAVKVAACAVDLDGLESAPEALRAMPYVVRRPAPSPEPIAAVLDAPAPITPPHVAAENPTNVGKDRTMKLIVSAAILAALGITEDASQEEFEASAKSLADQPPLSKLTLNALGARNESDGKQKASELSQLSTGLLAVTGASTNAGAMAKIAEWKIGAEQTSALAKKVSELETTVADTKRDSKIEILSREGKLPPALHAFARTQTAEQLAQFEAAAPVFAAASSVTEQNDPNANIVLTEEQRAICKHLQVSETAYLEQLKLDRTKGRQAPAGA